MASIKKRPDGRWRARYRDETGREHAKHFARKIDAQKWLNEVTASLVTGQYVDPAAGKIAFKAYAESWRAAQVHRRKTAERIAYALEHDVYPVIGDRPIRSLRTSDMQAFVKGLAARMQPSTVRTTFNVVRQVMRAAVVDRVIASSPCTGVVLPRARKGQVQPLARETVKALAEALPARYAAAVWLAAGSGMRPGETLGVRVGDVDFLRRVVHVRQQLSDRATLEPLKTAASYRTIPLPDVVLERLAAHLAAYGSGDHELVFTSPRGRPIQRKTFSKVWHAAAIAVGAPDARFHDLRHFYASVLIAAGESVKTVQARLGHERASVTLDTYAHLWPDGEESTRAAVQAALSAQDHADSVRTGDV